MVLLSIALLASFISTSVALIVYLRDRNSREAQTLLGIIACSSAWVVCVNIQGIVGQEYALWLLRLAFVFVLLATYAFLLFVRELAGTKHSAMRIVVELLLLIGFMGMCLSSFVVSSIEQVPSATYTIVSRGVLYPLVIAGILFFLSRSLYVLFTAWRRNVGLKRTQLLLILIGLSLGAASAIITNIILPNITQTTYPSRYAFLTIVVWTVVFVYAVVRHRFMNVRQVLARAIGYITTLGALAVLYAFVVLVLFEGYVRPHINNAGVESLIQILFVLLAAIAFSPLKQLFDKASNDLFYRDAYDPQEIINEVNTILVATSTIESLIHGVVHVLRRELKVSYVFVHITDTKRTLLHSYFSGQPVLDAQKKNELTMLLSEQKAKVLLSNDLEGPRMARSKARRLNEFGAAGSFRIKTANVRGLLVVGYKRSGNGMSKQDAALLRILSDDIAIAIQNIVHTNEIDAFNETLSARIEEATAELRASNKKLKLMDSTKDEFISLTSHQLRTPLTTVKGYISMLLDGDAGELTKQQRRLLEESFHSSQRMVHLISDFLNISRIQTGRFEMELSETDLAGVLNEEIEQLQLSAKSRQIALAYEKPSQFPMVHIDEAKIRQVMMNFIDNAIYYSPPNTTVKVVLLYAGQHIEFRVVDQGIGVPASEQHKLFSKFARASNAKKQRPDGTGIGLFMAKKIIVALGGSIIFQSKENKGSTFGFRLPLQKTPQDH